MLRMATLNPFDLLDDDAEDPSQLAVSIAADKSRKPALSQACLLINSTPPSSKQPPPSQAVREARSDAHVAVVVDLAVVVVVTTVEGNNGYSGGYSKPSEEGDVSKPSYERRGGGGVGPPRGGRRGEAGEGERPRRAFERRSGTGRGGDFKREGAGRGNWGTPGEEVLAQLGLKNEKDVVEKPADDDANKENTTEVEEQKEPEVKEMTLDEYEKILEEKRKALQSQNTSERKVDTKVFESMQHSQTRRTEGENYYRGGRGGRGRGGRVSSGGGFSGNRSEAAPAIADTAQFPSLGGKEMLSRFNIHQPWKVRFFSRSTGNPDAILVGSCSSSSLPSPEPSTKPSSDQNQIFPLNKLIARHKAQSFFDQAPFKDAASWNTMITGYARRKEREKARELFYAMTEKNEVSWNAMISGYVESGDLETASRFFKAAPVRGVVAWTAMITGYMKAKKVELAEAVFKDMTDGLKLFKAMLEEGARPNSSGLSSVLLGCSELSALRFGRQVHQIVCKSSTLCNDITALTSLVSMYCKCGELGDEDERRCGVERDDLRYAQHGKAEKALLLFREMRVNKTRPDWITFVAVLLACNHAGMVDTGVEYFDSMVRDYRVEPRPDHYTCMVDLLGRAGKLEEALELIRSMPFKPHAAVFGTLLGACRVHKNVDLGELAAEKLLELDRVTQPLANIYASRNRWEDVARVRKRMKQSNVVKAPGYSWIEIRNKVHHFRSSDRIHPELDSTQEAEGDGEEDETSWIQTGARVALHDVEEEQKERLLLWHSEKLLLLMGGSRIQVFKNLRICGDCHKSNRIYSEIERREIVVRDTTRFHHFKDGSCSCGGRRMRRSASGSRVSDQSPSPSPPRSQSVATMEDDVELLLPRYDPSSQPGKREKSRLRSAENVIHFIPLLLLLCVVILWLFSHSETNTSYSQSSPSYHPSLGLASLLTLTSFRLKNHVFRLEALANVVHTRFEARQIWEESRQDACLSSTSQVPVLRPILHPLLPRGCEYSDFHCSLSRLLFLYSPVPMFLSAIFVFVHTHTASPHHFSQFRYEVYIIAITGLGLVVSVVEERYGRNGVDEREEEYRGLALAVDWSWDGEAGEGAGCRLELGVVVEVCGSAGGWDGWKMVCMYGAEVVLSYVVVTVFTVIVGETSWEQ
ncbi:hypothetical protein HID58_003947 [Brassica napus]|uniref:Hyaluronan/mRNA-binding protein domain-containing protein n=1 Tax=Brassica napus TaxID=3708 RepID=A0ABQ7XL48_BRANA|nr:hypothetical protein HID58_003947 [Brassica napus]